MLLRDSLGNIGMWIMNGPVITLGAFVGSPGGYDVVAVADFNGDGKSDILLRDSFGNVGIWDVLLRNSTTSDVEMWLMNGSVIVSGASVATPGAVFDVH